MPWHASQVAGFGVSLIGDRLARRRAGVARLALQLLLLDVELVVEAQRQLLRREDGCSGPVPGRTRPGAARAVRRRRSAAARGPTRIAAVAHACAAPRCRARMALGPPSRAAGPQRTAIGRRPPSARAQEVLPGERSCANAVHAARISDRDERRDAPILVWFARVITCVIARDSQSIRGSAARRGGSCRARSRRSERAGPELVAGAEDVAEARRASRSGRSLSSHCQSAGRALRRYRVSSVRSP